jgi:hypothetical protein
MRLRAAADKKLYRYLESNLVFQLLAQAAEFLGKGRRERPLKHYTRRKLPSAPASAPSSSGKLFLKVKS